MTIFISALVTILHAFNYSSIDLYLVFPLIVGSIMGVQLGQKLGQFLDSTELKSLFALLLLSVAIAIGYDSFFRESKEIESKQILNDNLSTFAEFTVNFSNENPFLFGAFAILLAISLGAMTAVIRKILSPIARKFISDLKQKSSKKKEEIKFPEK